MAAAVPGDHSNRVAEANNGERRWKLLNFAIGNFHCRRGVYFIRRGRVQPAGHARHKTTAHSHRRGFSCSGGGNQICAWRKCVSFFLHARVLCHALTPGPRDNYRLRAMGYESRLAVRTAPEVSPQCTI
jgi:hypothetical protein